ncbi:hypothetical protein ACIGHG_14845 [Bacillus sp. NPDC077411]|uniref:hypothetical protein n=1 Tax=Bacillus sp. NPDC077411 TaxID=3363947 RepID=UPI0037C66460
MNNQPMYFPYANYNQLQYYPMQTPGYQSFEDIREIDDDVYRPDDAEDAPTSAPPAQAPSVPSTFSSPVQMGQIRSLMCNCLGRWGFIGLKGQGPFGRNFWFYPTEVRTHGVSGYTWQAGRRRKVSYRYSQIRNFICVS